MFHHIIYLSTATELFKREQLTAMLEQARRNNAKDGITGLLLYKDKSFIQLIEGPEAAVDARFNKIQADRRHYNIRLLDKTEKPHRTFKEWHMGFFDIMKESPKPEGFVDYFAPGASLDALIDTPDQALQLLSYFRSRS
ncbi:BLUF domain-containing protein [Bacterioplanoides sp.]|uniref:BLUF domain-containing protein n=1 Tax=Bacterioplanoides sp. TaxID=2066072 RepID=UPI003B00B28A